MLPLFGSVREPSVPGAVWARSSRDDEVSPILQLWKLRAGTATWNMICVIAEMAISDAFAQKERLIREVSVPPL